MQYVIGCGFGTGNRVIIDFVIGFENTRIGCRFGYSSEDARIIYTMKTSPSPAICFDHGRSRNYKSGKFRHPILAFAETFSSMELSDDNSRALAAKEEQ